MKILVLEDNRARGDYFIHTFYKHDIIITDNAYEAIEYLKENIFDYIFLDHDLGPDNGSGADVAAYLCGNIDNENNDANIIIHSWNTPAAKSMNNSLKNAVFFPFGSKDFFKVGKE